jgi:hypothetical protein
MGVGVPHSFSVKFRYISLGGFSWYRVQSVTASLSVAMLNDLPVSVTKSLKCRSGKITNFGFHRTYEPIFKN